MKAEPSTEHFDCVGYMRNVRDRIRAEIPPMDDAELTLHCYRYSDPMLKGLVQRQHETIRHQPDADPR